MRRLLSSIALLCVSLNAWGISFNPASPTTSGTYTVTATVHALGCYEQVDIYQYCYSLYESANGGGFVVVASGQGQTQWTTPTAKTVGTYDYMVAKYVNAWGPEAYEEVIETGQMVVQSQAVNFTITNASGTEGGSVVFTVTKNGTTSQTTGVSWSTNTSGTATSGSDYTAASGSLSFGPSVYTQTFTVNTLQNSTAEYAESFGVALSGATGPGASVGSPGAAGGTINDDDPVPTTSISDAIITESGDLVFTATLSHQAVYSVSVNVAVTNGSAAVGSDYSGCGCTGFGFNALETSTQFVIHTLNDAVYEGDETLTVTITPLSGPIGDGSGLGTITDAADAPYFTINDPVVDEGGTLGFTVTQNGASVFTHVVSYATADYTALVSDGDYTAASSTLSFGPTGAAQQGLPVYVATIDESPARLEATQQLLLNLGNGGLNGATISDSQGVGTINNDDSVWFTINDPSIDEGGTLSFTVTRNGASDFTHAVSYATANGSALLSDNDYVAASGSVSFPPSTAGAPTQSVSVTTVDESPAKLEAAETALVNLANGGQLNGATIGDSQGVGTITNDDSVSFTINDPSIDEGGTLSFTVTRNGASDFTHAVSYATANGSALLSDNDYVAASGSVSFPPSTAGAPTLSVSVTTVDESPAKLEAAETALVNLTNGGQLNGATIGDSQGVGTITNDDSVSFTINDPSIDEGGALSFTVTRNGASDFTHAVSYATANGSALLSDNDYVAASGSLSFPPSTAGAPTQSVSVTTVDESPAKLEAAETALVNLSNGGQLNGATIGDSQGVGTITNDDSVSFTINDPSIDEGGTLSFTVTRNGASDFTHAVSYATANGSALLSDSDYVAASGSLSFPPSTAGAPTQAVSVTTVDESPTKVEASETVLANLTNGGQLNGATIGDSQGAGTITNDDSVSFTINDAVSAEGTVVAFTVTKTGLTDLAHSVQWSTADGSATVGNSDYTAVALTTLNFSSGQATQVVNVSSTVDSVSEPHEGFTANLSNPGVWSTIGDASGAGTINNDDAPGAPSNLTGPIGFTGNSVTLTWTGGSGYLTHYEVEKTFDGAVATLNTGSTSASYAVGSLTTDGLYRFRVRACTTAGGYCSGWSSLYQTVRSNADETTGVPLPGTGSGDAGPSTGLTADFNGIVTGAAGVAPSGAATYSIPIAIPPGTRGMQPALALAYMSHGGEGTVGRGWALAGASSSVTRCGTTLAQDGAIHAVDYTAADRFCLDGQRLVRTSSTGVYGGDGTKYRTELESFRDVVSNGGTASSPNSFTVRTPDGRTLHYGGTAATNFNASTPNTAQVAAWLLRRVEDKYGNFYDVTYFEDEPNGYFHTSRIDYTGHSTTPVRAAYASVELLYDPIANPIKRYHAGSVTSLRQRLAKIVVKNDSAAVREYVLAYNEGETAPPSGMSRLTSVKECAPTQATGVCTAPTTFDWIDEIGGMDAPQTFPITVGGHEEWVDLNGDGRTDYVTFSGVTAQQTVALSNGTGFASSQTWTAQAIDGNHDYKFADMDGDGDADFVVFGKPGTVDATHKVYKSNGTAYQAVESWAAQDTQSGRAFSDFNGDGRTDSITWNNSVAEPIPYTVSLSIGNAYTTLTWSGPKLVGGAWPPDSWDFHEVNGDGRADLVLVKGTTHRIYVSDPASSGFGAAPIEATTTVLAAAGGTWADVNGDSLLDYVQTYDLYDHPIALWTGKTYANEVWHGPRWSDPPFMRDLNGDGLADYNGGTESGLSTGIVATGFAASTPWTGFTGYNMPAHAFPDIDGDGKPDFKTGQGSATYRINLGQPVHLMQKVTDGLGMETRFEYKPLTDGTVHTKSTNAVYPIADMVNAVHVVSRMKQSDGLGDFFDTDYRYEGFKVDKSGRGSLGFAKVTAEDIDRKVKTVTTYAQTDGANYAQTYARTGLPIAVDVTVTDKLDNGTNLPQLIADSDRVYVVVNGVTSYDGGPAIKYVCVDTDTSVDIDVESGTALRTSLTDNDPANTGVPCDAYGNPGQAGTADSSGTPLNRRVTVTDHVPNTDVVYRTDTVTYFKSDATANNETDWLLNMPTRQIAKPLVDGIGDADKDRTTAIEYVVDPVTGKGLGTVLKVIREPGQSAPLKLTTAFAYDDFGNRTTETITPSDAGPTPSVPLPRMETVQFDTAGRFPNLLTNALGQQTILSIDPRFGAALEIDGPNATSGAFNDKITRTFDAFGRLKDERQPDGSYEVVYYKSVGASASGIADRTTAKVMIETAVQNTAWGTTPATRMTPIRTFLDGYGRELRKRTRAFDDASFVHLDTFYDSRGRVEKTSEPFFEGQTPQWNTPAYDVLGRPVGLTAADSTQTTTTDYDAFTVTTTDAGGRTNRLISDALGRVSRVENLSSAGVVQAVTEYLYDKAGNVWTVQKRTPGGSPIANTAIVNTFDRLGRRLTTTDPDLGAGAAGRVDFEYDSLDDLRREQTPRLRAHSVSLFSEIDYDQLGRLTAKRDPSTSLTQTVTSTFVYDQVPTTPQCEVGKREAGIGHLTREEIAGGGEPGLTVDYCYSPGKFGRLDSEQRLIGGTPYQTDFSYDEIGRLSQVKYPATITWPAASRYAVNYNYNPRGYLERVTEAQGSTVLFQTMGANARGQIEKAYLGDGSRTKRNFVKGTERLSSTNAAIGGSQLVQNFVYTYDAVGNMSGRGDLINNLSETFGYDPLDRLTSSTVTNGTGPHQVAYQYDDAAGNLGNLTHKSDISTLPSASMTYSTTERPHAVTSLNTGSATRTFTYNANGSLVDGQVDSGTRTITWTSDELPASVTIGTTSRTFSYGPDRQRYKQVWVSGGTTRTYTYAGEHYVQEAVTSGGTEHKLYLYANGEQIGYVSDDGTPETRYFHKDHLGSTTTIVTDQNWAGREKLSYDAWGKRRSGTDWWSAASAASEERGYTGHEHLDDVSLIHMNGRLLDPKLGRVISADPTVPDPLYSQSYNRFSYVYNNPLKYTDPSGFGPRDNDHANNTCPPPLRCSDGKGGLGGLWEMFNSGPDYHENEFVFHNYAGYLSWLDQEAGLYSTYLAVNGPGETPKKTDQGGTPPTTAYTYSPAVGKGTGVVYDGVAYVVSEEKVPTWSCVKAGYCQTRTVVRPDCNVSPEYKHYVCDAVYASYLIENTILAAVSAVSLARFAMAASAEAASAGVGTQLGYHATRPENLERIIADGLRSSTAGRAGSGVYVSDTAEGALAEVAAHDSSITPVLLQVRYTPGSNAVVQGLTRPKIEGPLPLAADTISFESVRLPGTVNTVIRNESAVVVGVGP